MRSVRFWTYCNEGIVKLTVKEGEALEFSTGGSTDEGCAWYCERYWLEYGVLWRGQYWSGRDCDGGYSRSCEEFWKPEHGVEPMYEWNAQGEMTELKEARPNWQESKTWQRDYYAEAAGY